VRKSASMICTSLPNSTLVGKLSPLWGKLANLTEFGIFGAAIARLPSLSREKFGMAVAE